MGLKITQFDGTFDLRILENGETVSLFMKIPLTVRIKDAKGEFLLDVKEGEWVVRMPDGGLQAARELK